MLAKPSLFANLPELNPYANAEAPEVQRYIKENSAAKDLVNQPPHYNQGGIECIDALKAALGAEDFQGYLRGNAMKYLWRAPHKGAFEQDLDKAIWYINRLKKEISNAP